MKKRLFSLVLAICLILTAVPFAFAAEVPGSFEVYMTLTKLRAEYPEGTPWNDDNIYKWNGGIFTHGAGCAGFAFILSDAAFGNLPARKLTGVSADDLRPGDILRLNGDTHSVIVLQNTYYGIVVAEGNYNASIHWDRVISQADAESADYVLTRYPENWVDSAPAKPILETAQIMNQLNWMEKSFPQGMHWGYNYSYNWQGGILNGSAGSYAFAMLLSDTVFSNLPACTKQGMTLEQLRVGDIVVDKNGGAGIVVEKLGDHVRLAEGQDGGIVNWEKSMNESDLAQAIMTITRYPDAQTAEGEKTLEQKAQDAMNGMRDQYPEGKNWGSGDSYTWQGNPNQTGTGCVAFAFILSDGAFCDLPAREVTNFEFEDVRAGDILKISGYTVIVLETYENAVMIAEGEYNGGIHWGRYLSRAEVESAELLITRYPVDYKEPDKTVQIYQPSGAVIGSGNCGFEGAPTQWKLTDDGTLVIYGNGATENYNIMFGNTPWSDWKDSITRIVVQEGITELGSASFMWHSAVTEVILPSTLKKIGMNCFDQCTSLKSIRLPQGLVELDSRAFILCSSLENVRFPASLESIGGHCFEGSALTHAELNSGLHYIGMDAFKNCDALVSAVVPGTVINNMQGTFCWCDNLKTLTLCEGLEEVGRSFAEDSEHLEQIWFPSTIKEIGDNAFAGTGIREMTLPTSLEYLGEQAFSSCPNLQSVTINHNVAEFGNYAFAYCDSLKNFYLSPEVTYIGKSTFINCDGLDVVRVPGTLGRVEIYQFADTSKGGPVVAILEEGITSIAKFAFEQAANLKEVHLPASLERIEESAFSNNAGFWEMTFYYYGTPEQWAQVEVQSGNYSMDGAKFVFAETMECHHTVTVTLPAVEPTCLTTGLSAGEICKVCDAVLVPQTEMPVAEHSYENLACIWCGEPDPRPADTVIASGECGSNVTWKVQLNGTMIISGSGKMYDYGPADNTPYKEYRDQITNVIVEQGVTSIGNDAFWQFRAMETATIGPNVQTIGNSAFATCTSLKDILIPEKVQRIGDNAFGNCSSLEKVEIQNGDIYLSSWCFARLEKLETVIIALGNISMHGNNPFEGTPWLRNAMDENGFVVMGEYLLYYGGTDPNPVIPAGVKHMESNAFDMNENVQKLVIPEGVETIEQWCFAYCFNLQEVVIPASVEKIAGYAFYLKSEGKTVTFLGDAPAMENTSFYQTKAEVFYPAGNDTWTDALRNYGGTLTWTAVEMGPCTHATTREIPGVEATCNGTGLTAGKVCANCGLVVEEQQKVPALGHDWQGQSCSRCGEEKPAGLAGDVDGSGNVNYQDALMILRYTIGLQTLEREDLADFDGNGRVDYSDALKILRASIGLK